MEPAAAGLLAARRSSVSAPCALATVRAFSKHSSASRMEAVRLDPKHAKAHTNLGSALLAKEDLDGAVASYKEAIRLDPKFAMAHDNLGNALRAKGDLDGAVASYKEAIRLDPKDAVAHYNLGLALHAKGDQDGAIASYKEAIRLDPNLAPAHIDLGIALSDKGNLDGAIEDYNLAKRRDSQVAQAYKLRAEKARTAGNAAQAEADMAIAADSPDGVLAAVAGACPPVGRTSPSPASRRFTPTSLRVARPRKGSLFALHAAVASLQPRRETSLSARPLPTR